MNIATIRGRSAAAGHDQGEKVYVSVYNLVAAEIAAGTPLCYSHTAGDGVSVVLPVTGTNLSNFAMLAGIAQDTIASGDYSATVVAKGVVEARVYGVATVLVAGANLCLISTESYIHYGSPGQFSGSTATGQPIVFTALATNATVDTTVQDAYINAL